MIASATPDSDHALAIGDCTYFFAEEDGESITSAYTASIELRGSRFAGENGSGSRLPCG